MSNEIEEKAVTVTDDIVKAESLKRLYRNITQDNIDIRRDELGTKEEKLSEKITLTEDEWAIVRSVALSDDHTKVKEMLGEYEAQQKSEKAHLAVCDKYTKACNDIKDMRKSLKDGFKAELALQKLALKILKSKGKDVVISKTKEFTKAAKESGKEYVDEFIKKDKDELKNFITRITIEMDKAKEELEASQAFLKAKNYKSNRDAEVRSALEKLKKMKDLISIKIELNVLDEIEYNLDSIKELEAEKV